MAALLLFLLREQVAAYNAYFDTTGVDLIMMPCGRAATPDLDQCSSGTVPLTINKDGCVKEGIEVPNTGKKKTSKNSTRNTHQYMIIYPLNVFFYMMGVAASNVYIVLLLVLLLLLLHVYYSW